VPFALCSVPFHESESKTLFNLTTLVTWHRYQLPLPYYLINTGVAENNFKLFNPFSSPVENYPILRLRNHDSCYRSFNKQRFFTCFLKWLEF
jgi:hypothetical protein